jgi:DNA-binding MarR family transcriptional regulator
VTPHTIGILIVAAGFAAVVIADHTHDAHHRDSHQILTALREHPGPHTGLDVASITRMRTGRVYPALTRLEQAGQVTSYWVPGEHPRRRLYALPKEHP